MLSKKNILKAMSESGISEEQLLASIKEKYKSSVPACRRSVKVIPLIAASLAAVLVLCSAGYALIPAFRQYFDSRVEKNHTVYTDIYTAEELDGIRNNLSGNYRLMTDITFTDEDYAQGGRFEGGFEPIGDTENAFTGIFNGNGHTIRNLQIHSDKVTVGLFGQSFSYNGIGIIMNLRIDGGNIRTSGTYGEVSVGAIAGRAAYLYNCSVEEVTISGYKQGFAGGITGYADIIDSCYSNALVIGIDENMKVGALAGLACTVSDSCANSSLPLCGEINMLPTVLKQDSMDIIRNRFYEKQQDQKLKKILVFFDQKDLNDLPLDLSSTRFSISGIKNIYSIYNFTEADELSTIYIFDPRASSGELLSLNRCLSEYFTREEAGELLFGKGAVIGTTNCYTVSEGESYHGLDFKNAWTMKDGEPRLLLFETPEK